MQGNAEVLGFLNEVLRQELAAISQFLLHAAMCRSWGYSQLAEYKRPSHVQSLTDRILQLGGLPHPGGGLRIKVGTEVRQQVENDLALELEAVPRLREAIHSCETAGDHGSRELFQRVLADAERHVDYLEGQLHAIQEIGLENYLLQR